MKSKRKITSSSFSVKTVLWFTMEAILISEKAGWLTSPSQKLQQEVNSPAAQDFILSSADSDQRM